MPKSRAKSATKAKAATQARCGGKFHDSSTREIVADYFEEILGPFVGFCEKEDDEVEEWIELEDQVDADEDQFLEDLDDIYDEKEVVVLERKVAEEEHRWRAKGNNSGVRNSGTSRSTFYRKEANKVELRKAAEKSQKLTSFFSPVDADLKDPDTVDDNMYSMPGRPSMSHEKCTDKYSDMEAIEQLNTKFAIISKNKHTNAKNTLDKWDYLAAISICSYLQLVRSEGERSKMASSRLVASTMFQKSRTGDSYKARCIRSWAAVFKATGELPSYRQGKHIKTPTIITDENVQQYLKAHLRSLDDDVRTPTRFANDLNTELLAELGQDAPVSVSRETARRWMVYLDFAACVTKKGYYTDGHNRSDVVAYRDDEFLPAMAQYERRMDAYSGKEMETVIEPVLLEGEKKVVLITHDECTFYANDGKRVVWMEGGKKKMRPKSVGSSLMISGFTCQCHGFCSDDTLGLKSWQLFLAGKNREGWFTNDDLIEQTKKLFPLFEKLHPNCDLLFGFDNSMSHHKRADDGLNVPNELPLKDGGKNAPMMRATSFVDAKGIIQQQCMQTDEGEPKGMISILRERGLWDGFPMVAQCVWCKNGVAHAERPGAGEPSTGELTDRQRKLWDPNRCCARRCLSQQPDFLAQREWLREVIEDAGHEIIYYPKYHCELNYIEMVWCYLKRHLRDTCTYSFPDLKEKVPRLLDDYVSPAFCRRVSRHCFRTMGAYRLGLEGPLLDFAVKKYSSHRKIPDDSVAQVTKEYEEYRIKHRKSGIMMSSAITERKKTAMVLKSAKVDGSSAVVAASADTMVDTGSSSSSSAVVAASADTMVDNSSSSSSSVAVANPNPGYSQFCIIAMSGNDSDDSDIEELGIGQAKPDHPELYANLFLRIWFTVAQANDDGTCGFNSGAIALSKLLRQAFQTNFIQKSIVAGATNMNVRERALKLFGIEELQYIADTYGREVGAALPRNKWLKSRYYLLLALQIQINVYVLEHYDGGYLLKDAYHVYPEKQGIFVLFSGGCHFDALLPKEANKVDVMENVQRVLQPKHYYGNAPLPATKSVQASARRKREISEAVPEAAPEFDNRFKVHVEERKKQHLEVPAEEVQHTVQGITTRGGRQTKAKLQSLNVYGRR